MVDAQRARVLLLTLLTLMLAACERSSRASDDPPPVAVASTNAEGVFIVGRAPTRAFPTPVVVLLPGASGLKIFDDTGHYHRVAQTLNDAGYDTIIVDYKTYSKRAGVRESDPPGRRGFISARDALGWARSTSAIDAGARVALVGWSLGAWGVWHTVGTEGLPAQLDLAAAAVYYPVIPEDSRRMRTSRPMLVLTGEEDDVCAAEDIRKFVATNDTINGAAATLRVYPHARHGFDVSTLAQRRTVSLIPLVGPSATFQYNADASEQARSELLSFLRQHLRPGEP